MATAACKMCGLVVEGIKKKCPRCGTAFGHVYKIVSRVFWLFLLAVIIAIVIYREDIYNWLYHAYKV